MSKIEWAVVRRRGGCLVWPHRNWQGNLVQIYSHLSSHHIVACWPKRVKYRSLGWSFQTLELSNNFTTKLTTYKVKHFFDNFWQNNTFLYTLQSWKMLRPLEESSRNVSTRVLTETPPPFIVLGIKTPHFLFKATRPPRQ